jgi:transcriptional regulator with XRE-family HTH domain
LPDSSWRAFRAELKAHLDGERSSRPVLVKQLAARLQVTPQTVSNWLGARSKPALHQLPAIAETLGMGADPDQGIVWDPLYLPARMGIVPDQPIDSSALVADAVTAQKLRHRVARLHEAAQLGQATGSTAIIRRAFDLGTWEVGFHPAMEGPAGYQIHVADRITFRRTDSRPTDKGEVWADFEQELRACGAILARTKAPRWEPLAGSVEATWTIPLVGATRPSSGQLAYEGVRSIAVISLTAQSWGNDVASHLADVLGYGQASTRAIASEISGSWTGPTNLLERRRTHDYLLRIRPFKRVWSHWDHDGPLTPDGTAGDGLWIVYLSESDKVLSESLAVQDREIGLDQARAVNAKMVALAEQRPDVLAVEIAPKSSARADYWEQTFHAMLSVLRWLERSGAIDGPTVVQRARNNQRTDQLFRWLRDQGWPAD